MKQNANNVTKAIERVLTFEHRAFVWRQNNHATFDIARAAGVVLRASNTKKWRSLTEWINILRKCYNRNTAHMGVPDVVGVLPGGRFIGVEIKVGSDKMSEHQKLFKADLESKGGIYIEARSLDDFMEKFKQYQK